MKIELGFAKKCFLIQCFNTNFSCFFRFWGWGRPPVHDGLFSGFLSFCNLLLQLIHLHTIFQLELKSSFKAHRVTYGTPI